MGGKIQNIDVSDNWDQHRAANYYVLPGFCGYKPEFFKMGLTMLVYS